MLGMAGLGIAWGLYIFSGAVSQITLLAMSVAGAGIGAGIGPGVAWLRLDRNRPSVSFFILGLAILGGALGGWLGYQYGAGPGGRVLRRTRDRAIHLYCIRRNLGCQLDRADFHLCQRDH